MTDTNLQQLAAQGEIAGFAIDEHDTDMDYGTAWDIVDEYLSEEYNQTEFWQHRTCDDCSDFKSGFINGIVWTATWYDDEDAWGFDFITVEEYQEYWQ